MDPSSGYTLGICQAIIRETIADGKALKERFAGGRHFYKEPYWLLTGIKKPVRFTAKGFGRGAGLQDQVLFTNGKSQQPVYGRILLRKPVVVVKGDTATGAQLHFQ